MYNRNDKPQYLDFIIKTKYFEFQWHISVRTWGVFSELLWWVSKRILICHYSLHIAV